MLGVITVEKNKTTVGLLPGLRIHSEYFQKSLAQTNLGLFCEKCQISMEQKLYLSLSKATVSRNFIACYETIHIISQYCPKTSTLLRVTRQYTSYRNIVPKLPLYCVLRDNTHHIAILSQNFHFIACYETIHIISQYCPKTSTLLRVTRQYTSYRNIVPKLPLYCVLRDNTHHIAIYSQNFHFIACYETIHIISQYCPKTSTLLRVTRQYTSYRNIVPKLPPARWLS